MRRYQFERKFRHFCEGLTLDAKDMGVLNSALPNGPNNAL